MIPINTEFAPSDRFTCFKTFLNLYLTETIARKNHLKKLTLTFNAADPESFVSRVACPGEDLVTLHLYNFDILSGN